MSIKSYCYVMTALTNDAVSSVKAIIFNEKLMAKAAVLKTHSGINTMEIVVSDEGTMKFIVTLFEKRTGHKLTYVEDK